MARTKADRVKQGDVNLACTVIKQDDEVPDEYADLFDGTAFEGTNEQLSEIRSAMRRAEKEAPIGQDKSLYDARFNLQFLLDRDK